MPSRTVEITEDTKLPAKVVWSVLVTAIIGTTGLTTMFVKQDIAGARISALETNLDAVEKERKVNREKYIAQMTRVELSLERIEARLGTKADQ